MARPADVRPLVEHAVAAIEGGTAPSGVDRLARSARDAGRDRRWPATRAPAAEAEAAAEAERRALRIAALAEREASAVRAAWGDRATALLAHVAAERSRIDGSAGDRPAAVGAGDRTPGRRSSARTSRPTRAIASPRRCSRPAGIEPRSPSRSATPPTRSRRSMPVRCSPRSTRLARLARIDLAGSRSPRPAGRDGRGRPARDARPHAARTRGPAPRRRRAGRTPGSPTSSGSASRPRRSTCPTSSPSSASRTASRRRRSRIAGVADRRPGVTAGSAGRRVRTWSSRSSRGSCPTIYGLRFRNSFPPGPTVRFGPFDTRFLGFGDAAAGLCGGMALTARDLFEAKVPAPPDTTPPANGSPRFDALVRRQVQSLDWFRVPLRYLNLQALRGDPPTGIAATLGREPARVDAVLKEWPVIRAELDSGHPSVVGLVRSADNSPAALTQEPPGARLRLRGDARADRHPRLRPEPPRQRQRRAPGRHPADRRSAPGATGSG